MARRAYALQTLLEQINTLYPNRNRASDGWLGDDAHQKTVSQHNPLPNGVVTAQDFTHDPANGVHGGDLAEWLNDDPRTWYVIWNRKIWDAKWLPYNGPNPHDRHVHISTKQDTGNYDNPAKWNLGGNMDRIKELEDMANYRQSLLDSIGREVSVNAPVDGNSAVQIITNIRTLGKLIDDRDKALAEVRMALENEKTKPPKEIIRTVEKIVEVATPVDPDSVVITKNSLWDWFKRIFK